MARTVEQIRADMCKGSPTCPECGYVMMYPKRYVGEATVGYYVCAANSCLTHVDLKGKKL